MLTYDDLEWVCQHLVVELGAPPASADLTAPDAAERLLLNRMSADVGAEVFPNVERSAVDVAAAMISTARAARQGRLVITAEELFRRTQLQSDFGAVSRAHPVDRELEVLRPMTVHEIVEAATELSTSGGYLIVVGPPGQGKSWVCQQVLDEMSEGGWLSAEHYCFLGDADGERNNRVLLEAVFGSLVSRLAAADPTIVVDQRPRFAGDEEALEGCLRRSLARNPDRRVALVIDGIDHITRVRARMGDRFDPSKTLVEALAALDLPAGVVVIILSQPGLHLQPLDRVGARTIDVPGLSKTELELLSARFNILPGDERHLPVRRPLLEDADGIARFLEALELRSSGNALYATYLCRETLRHAETLVDPAETVRNLPQFDGTLKNYYDHLHNSLGAETGWVADVIALVDFAVTRAELRQIRPDVAHRVDAALALLAPVLVERATQGGVRVYHESFARYLRGAFDRESHALRALLERIAAWLEGKGLFVDPRSFRALLSILADSGNDRRVIDLVDRAFVAKAVAAGFPSSAIAANLATGVGSAARLGEWAVVVRCVELARAAQMYEYERFDSLLVSFADVLASVIGTDTLAARLVNDDRLAMPARAGLQMCAPIDRLGATAPWRSYMLGFLREREGDNTAYGEASDRAVALAWIRGRLRLSSIVDRGNPAEQSPSIADAIDTQADEVGAPGEERDLAAPIDWTRLAEWVEHDDLPMFDMIDAVIDTYGSDGVIQLIHALDKPGEACLAYAEKLATQLLPEKVIPSPRTWAVAAVAHGVRAGSIHRVLKLGVGPGSVAHQPTAAARERLLDLTRAVQEPSIQFDKNGNLEAWLDATTLAAHLDEDVLRVAEVLIAGEGWYRCWLRFAIWLSKAEASPSEKSQLALSALGLLTEDLRPFAGDPRACDLYSLRGAIHDTITRAIHLLEDTNWEEGLKILDTVSGSITTTISGELGGPVAPDFLLRLAVETATPTRHRAAEALIADEIAKGSARRYYSDLAEYRLVAARLALAAKDTERATVLWRETCEFLTAYGYHKDITIYEVLDPLPALIRADPQRGRLRVAAIQGLCERLPLHTDGRETRAAWSRWWEVLAKADPVAAIDLAVPTLLQKCNDPYELLDDALEDVWEEWYERVDPLISGALRLSLDKPLDRRDSEQLKRLAEDTTTDSEAIRLLMTWLVARADERPVSYSYSNDAELLAKDDIVVTGLNQIAASVDVPVISLINRASTPRHEAALIASPNRKSKNSTADVVSYSPFPGGLPGLSRAIRAWRRKPYDAQSEEWAVERFTNVIGYRLVELAADGRLEEAESALRSLGDSVTLGERSGILRHVAEGLERHGENRLAAVAYTLAWTRARGHGGWMTFGGQTELDSLERASALDAGVARYVVAEEVERAVAASYGPYGISQALVFAFASEAIRVNGAAPLDTAFAVWDEACAVISARAPRVSDDDDPDDPYLPPIPDAGQAVPGNLDAAFALAVLGSLFHPSRERKRRTLLATQLLLEQRPDVIASAVSFALSTISDPATLVWLLSVIDLSREKGVAVVAACQPVLRELSSRGLLTVRALARRLV
ncbi:MAG: AAA family ATPase, partial [Terracidiphilus sp.]